MTGRSPERSLGPPVQAGGLVARAPAAREGVFEHVLRLHRGILLALVGLVACAAPARADDRPPEKGGFTYSLGMPSLFKPYAGFEVQANTPGEGTELGGLVNLGIDKDLGNPIVGLAAVGAGAYGGYRGEQLDGGIRALFSVPSLLVGAGVDWNFPESRVDFLLRMGYTGRRGGVFGGGSTLVLSYLPTRDHSFSIGVNKPLWGKHLGRSRARRDHVELDDRKPQRVEIVASAPHAEFEAALDSLRERVQWVFRLTQPFAETRGADAEKAIRPVAEPIAAHIALRDAGFPEGHTALAEVEAYHRTLERAFALALAGRQVPDAKTWIQAREVARVAREALLDEVLFPYNRLIGQFKTNDSIYGLIAVAQTRFARAVLETDALDESVHRELWLVFQTLCDFIETERARARKRWEDPRLVWLPLQLALKADQHDTQAEIDALIERALDRTIRRENRLWYVVNESFQWEMARTVRLSENYHVLWIHDYRGENAEGEPDLVSLRQTINYLETMTARVRKYDETGRFPTYLILIDQHFFEINRGRMFLGVLEDPMRHHLNLPRGYEEWEDQLEQAQDDLTQAVEESQLLRLERSQYGEKWLHNYIKVHVTVTNQADPSFYSLHVAGIIPVPDNHMRDHRKIAFYDITEEDPYRGVAMFTGMGIGEHYAGANWEDRALMIQGPGALRVKEAARTLLLTQGFEPEEIPWVLRALPRAADYDDRIAAERASKSASWMGENWFEHRGGVLQLHSGTGFCAKPVEVAKAILYSLMPPGSVLQIPDSLWQNYLYGSLLAGSALRGCRVMVISPALKHAPAGGAANMARAHDLMERLIVFNQILQEPIQTAGGLLAVGLYAPRQDVGDLQGRFDQAMANYPSWLDRVIPELPGPNRQARRELLSTEVRAALEEVGYVDRHASDDPAQTSPKLHLKANFFASSTGWAKLMDRPELGPLLVEHMRYLAGQSLIETTVTAEDLPDVRSAPEALVQAWIGLFDALFAEATPEERSEIAYYFTVGSVNLDYRSMVLNAETMIVVTGWQSLIGFVDFLLLPGLCEWVETPEQLDALLPAPSTVRRVLSNFIRVML